MAWFSTLTGFLIQTGDLVLGTDVAGQPDGSFNTLVDKVFQNTIDLDSRKLDKTGGTISGNLIVSGDFTVNGTLTNVNTTDLSITDNVIGLNVGESGAGVTLGLAGIQIDRGTATDSQMIWTETGNKWQFGVIGSLLDVASKLSTVVGNGNNNNVVYNFADGSTINWDASHTHVATDVGALPLTGGTLSGNLVAPNIYINAAVDLGYKLVVGGAVKHTSTSLFQGTLTVQSTDVLFDNPVGDFKFKIHANLVSDQTMIEFGNSTTPLARMGVGGTNGDIIADSTGQDFNIGTAGGGRSINFSTDNFVTSMMKLDGNGNVGIGTDVPAVVLEVYKSDSTLYTAQNVTNLSKALIKAHNPSTVVDTFASIAIRSGSADMSINGIYKGANSGDMAFVMNNSGTALEAMRILSNGNVNIGGIANLSKLTVTGSLFVSSGDSGTQGVSIVPSSGTNTQQIYTNFSNSGLEQDLSVGTFTHRADQLYLKKDGNVGIGTTAPQNTLHVSGGIICGVPISTNVLGALQLEQAVSPSIVIRSQYNNGQGIANVLQLSVDDANDRHVIWSRNSSGTLNDITFAFGTLTNTAMSIKSNLDVALGGNLQLSTGTNTANGTIRWSGTDVEGRIGGAWVSLSALGGGGAGSFWTDTGTALHPTTISRNVGIGHNNPSTRLHVFDNITNYATTIDNSNTAGHGLRINASNGTSTFAMRVRNYADVIDLFAIKGDGNVGIGIANPLQKLHVQGAIIAGDGPLGTDVGCEFAVDGGRGRLRLYKNGSLSWFQIFNNGTQTDMYDSSGGDIRFLNGLQNKVNLYLKDNGNVGIGTTASDTRLHIGNSTANPTIFTSQAVAGAQNTTNYVAGVTTSWIVGVHSSGSLNTDYTIGTVLNTAKLVVKADGKVGIGIDAPTKLFEVFAGFSAQDTDFIRLGRVSRSVDIGTRSSNFWPSIQAFNTASVAVTDLLINPDGGNVGIGTTGPAYKLDVVGTLHATGIATFGSNIVVTGTVDGRDIAVDGAKLDTIETSATADQTPAQILASLKTVDVNGTAGVNAGTLDGFPSSYFLTSLTNYIGSVDYNSSNLSVLDAAVNANSFAQRGSMISGDEYIIDANNRSDTSGTEPIIVYNINTKTITSVQTVITMDRPLLLIDADGHPITYDNDVIFADGQPYAGLAGCARMNKSTKTLSVFSLSAVIPGTGIMAQAKACLIGTKALFGLHYSNYVAAPGGRVISWDLSNNTFAFVDYTAIINTNLGAVASDRIGGVFDADTDTASIIVQVWDGTNHHFAKVSKTAATWVSSVSVGGLTGIPGFYDTIVTDVYIYAIPRANVGTSAAMVVLKVKKSDMTSEVLTFYGTAADNLRRTEQSYGDIFRRIIHPQTKQEIWIPSTMAVTGDATADRKLLYIDIINNTIGFIDISGDWTQAAMTDAVNDTTQFQGIDYIPNEGLITTTYWRDVSNTNSDNAAARNGNRVFMKKV